MSQNKNQQQNQSSQSHGKNKSQGKFYGRVAGTILTILVAFIALTKNSNQLLTTLQQDFSPSSSPAQSIALASATPTFTVLQTTPTPIRARAGTLTINQTLSCQPSNPVAIIVKTITVDPTATETRVEVTLKNTDINPKTVSNSDSAIILQPVDGSTSYQSQSFRYFSIPANTSITKPMAFSAVPYAHQPYNLTANFRIGGGMTQCSQPITINFP